MDGTRKRAFFVADHRAVRKYGLGAARPFPMPLGRYLKTQYLIRAATVPELAGKLGIDSGALVSELRAFNLCAEQGADPRFRRGQSSYNVFQGDHLHRPNACLAPIERPPFYAVEIFAGDLGSFIGLRVDATARVLNAAGAPIPKLYAVGNDAANVFSGACLGGGVTIGPAMVFGYVAGNAIAAAARPGKSS